MFFLSFVLVMPSIVLLRRMAQINDTLQELDSAEAADQQRRHDAQAALRLEQPDRLARSQDQGLGRPGVVPALRLHRSPA